MLRRSNRNDAQPFIWVMDENRFRPMVDPMLVAGPDWVPPPVWSAGILLLAVFLALRLHRVSLKAFQRFLVTDKPRAFLRTFVVATEGPSRLAFVI